jgi:AcrR family transcriptional regulator
MDAVYALLGEKSARDLTMEAVAKRAGVGKPTLYKWWPSKAALILAMFHERIDNQSSPSPSGTAEQIMRATVRRLICSFNGLFGKVMADLIAEGQSEPDILKQLYEQHMRPRREAAIESLRQAIKAGEFTSEMHPELVIDSVIGIIYFRMLLKFEPLTEEYGDQLIDQALRGLRQRRAN